MRWKINCNVITTYVCRKLPCPLIKNVRVRRYPRPLPPSDDRHHDVVVYINIKCHDDFCPRIILRQLLCL